MTVGRISDPTWQETEGESINTKLSSLRGQHTKEQKQGRYIPRIFESRWYVFIATLLSSVQQLLR